MAQESYVQVAVDGEGKQIRNISADVIQPDGTTATVYMQVVAIRDSSGLPLDNGNVEHLLRAIQKELQALRMMYGRATGQHFTALPAMTPDLGDIGGV